MVSRLCDDLLSRIFTYSLEKRDEYYTIISSSSAPLSLRIVDRRWHYVAMNTPELWRSLSIRRRIERPRGYYFEKDANIIYEWLGNSRGLPSSVQLCYGDIKECGGRLPWTQLLQTIKACLSEESTCERVYIRVPDECTEKFFWSLQNFVLHARTLRSLTLRSTRDELLLRRYMAWWKCDREDGSYPHYCHLLNVRELSALEQLEVHYPGPFKFDGTSESVRSLTMSLFMFRQLNRSIVESFPSLQYLTFDLRESLQLTLPHPTEEVTFILPTLHTLRIRSHLHGQCGKQVLEALFKFLRFPQLSSLQVRNLRSQDSDLRIFRLLPKCDNFKHLEELEVIDFPFKAVDACSFENVLAKMSKLHTLSYREVEIKGNPVVLANGFLGILQLTALKTYPVPPLKCIAIDTADLRKGQSSSTAVILRLFSFLDTWRMASEKWKKESSNLQDNHCQQVGESYLSHPVRRLLLPKGVSELLFARGVSAVCGNVRFEIIADAEEIVEENDLDDDDESSCRDETVVINGKAVPKWLVWEFERRQQSDRQVAPRPLIESHAESIQEVEQLLSGGLGWSESLAELEMLY